MKEKKLYCPNCGEEIYNWVTEKDLPFVGECCKTWRKWRGLDECPHQKDTLKKGGVNDSS